MFLPMLFHGEEGGTREAYGPVLGMESLSESTSSFIMRRRSDCARRAGRAREEGGACRVVCSLLGEGAWFEARVFVRVGACDNELRLMRVERAVLDACLGCVDGN